MYVELELPAVYFTVAIPSNPVFQDVITSDNI